jgi:hypothetical protein
LIAFFPRRGLEVIFPSQCIRTGTMVLAINQLKRTTSGRGFNVSVIMRSQTLFQVSTETEVQVAILPAAQDVDATTYSCRHGVRLAKAA